MTTIHREIRAYSRATPALLLLLLGAYAAVAPACGGGASGSTGGEGGSGATGSTTTNSTGSTATSACSEPPPDVTPREPDASCLSGDTCASNSDCPDGHRCNKALSPPACEKLYCGGAFTFCSDDVFCQEGMSCYGEACSPCDLCGTTKCSIDFSKDLEHCGCCNNPAPPGGTCKDGIPGCAPDQIVCPSGACANLANDPKNCGACGVELPSGVDCVNGSPGCSDGKSVCGDACVDLQSNPFNCGSCGAVCPVGSHCVAPLDLPLGCRVDSIDIGSCAQVCQSLGMGCTAGAWVEYASLTGCGATVDLKSCDEMPKDQVLCSGSGCAVCDFDQITCVCTPKAM